MIWMALESFWHFIWGWATVDLVVGIIAIAIAILEPAIIAKLFPNIRPWAIATAVIAFTALGILAHGYQNGLAEKQRQWDEAAANEIPVGEQAHTDAVNTVRAEPPDGMRNDLWNRDKREPQPAAAAKSPVRWLARHRIFRH